MDATHHLRRIASELAGSSLDKSDQDASLAAGSSRSHRTGSAPNTKRLSNIYLQKIRNLIKLAI